MAVAVTGASGHVGANLIRALIDKRQPVRAVAVVARTLTGHTTQP